MSYGFQVFDPEGNKVTDSTYLGYSLYLSGTANVVSQQATDVGFPTPITSQSPPVICVQVKPFNYAWIRLCKVLGSPGNWTGFRLVGDRLTNQFAHLGVVNYRVYANGVQSTDSHGLRISTPEGAISFDTGLRQLQFEASVVMGDWPAVWSGQGPQGNSSFRIVGHSNPNFTSPADSWLPLSLVNTSFVSTQESNISGKWQTYLMEVEISWSWFDGYVQIILTLLSAVPPTRYNVTIPVFCPIVLN